MINFIILINHINKETGKINLTLFDKFQYNIKNST